jgi:hypothetical protein
MIIFDSIIEGSKGVRKEGELEGQKDKSWKRFENET